MSPSSLFHALSLHFPARRSAASVAPWPEQSSFDKWLTRELDTMRRGVMSDASHGDWLVDASDIALAAQKTLIESIKNIDGSNCGQEMLEEYLDDDVELIDACGVLCDRMESVKMYTEALRAVLRCLGSGSDLNASALAKARKVLHSSGVMAMEKRCVELERCSSSLKKMAGKVAQGTVHTDLHEVLDGAKATALFVTRALQTALSFKTKHGNPVVGTHSRQTTSFSSSLHELHKQVNEQTERRTKSELRETVTAAKNVKALLKLCLTDKTATSNAELRSNVEDLKRSCERLEEWIKPLERKVNELYRNLICIRVAVLGTISKA